MRVALPAGDGMAGDASAQMLQKKFKSIRNLTSGDKEVYRELRRQSHITAEQKRRGNIKVSSPPSPPLPSPPLPSPPFPLASSDPRCVAIPVQQSGFDQLQSLVVNVSAYPSGKVSKTIILEKSEPNKTDGLCI